jgi:hypothetical protein
MIDQTAIQVRGRASAELEDAVARFLAGGGKIDEAPPLQTTPKPLSAHTLKGPSCRGRRIVKAAESLHADKRAAYIEQLRELAKTMSQGQAAEIVGRGKRSISQAAKLHNIKFQSGRPEPDRSNDSHDVWHILNYISTGITRNKAMSLLGLSFCHMSRLLQEYEIEYPTQKRNAR